MKYLGVSAIQAAVTNYHKTAWLKQQSLFITDLRLGGLRSGYRHGWALLRAFFHSALQWLPCCCVLTW